VDSSFLLFFNAHDGFTLRDLVSYAEKHNEANGEDNNDGESHNRSDNLGVEGHTDDPDVNRRRAMRQRNMLATLLLSQGVPMISHGDELGRTQNGNNNGYAQDNEITWIDWDSADVPLIEFTAALTRLRALHPTFRRSRFFDGKPVRTDDGSPVPDIEWLRPDGRTMQPEDWESGFGLSIGMFLNGRGIREKDRRGQPVDDLNFIVYFNSGDEAVDLVLPDARHGAGWEAVVDTAGELTHADPLPAAGGVQLEAGSILVLREAADDEEPTDDSVEASLRIQIENAATRSPAPKSEV
jgi:glycogen operon protein